jgi:predicted permease
VFIITSLERMVREARLAVRGLGRAPGYATVVVAVLGLSIGAATAVARLVDRVLLRPAGLVDPARLAVIWGADAGSPLTEVSYPDFLDLQEESRSFEQLAAHGSTTWQTQLRDAGDPVDLPMAAVSGGFFEVLGARPLLGRLLRPEDDRVGAERVAVASHSLWSGRFGSDPHVVGRRVRLDGRVHTIVGVLPPRFDYPSGAALWAPLRVAIEDVLSPEARKNWRYIGFLYVVGRLAPGVALESAREETSAVFQRISQRNGAADPERAVVTPLIDHVLGPARPALLMLLTAVGLIFALACANIAGLVLVRAWAREREIAVRIALGGSRRDIFRLLIVESVLLSACAAGAGLVVADACLRVFARLAPRAIGTQAVTLDAESIALALAAAAAAAGVTALWPMAVTLRPSLTQRLYGWRTARGGLGPRRQALIAVEVSLTLAVLTAASLAARSFMSLAALDLGYDARGIVFVDIPVGEERAAAPDQGRSFMRQVARALEAIPGVASAGGMSLKPLALGPIGDDNPIQLEGQTPDQARANPFVCYVRVTPGYFATLGIRIVAGRGFTDRDVNAPQRVAVVSETAARRLWGDTDVVGRRVRVYRGLPDPPLTTVVGVAASARHRELDRARLDFYAPEDFTETWALRTSMDSGAVASAVRGVLQRLDHDQPIEITTIERLVSTARRPWQFAATVLGGFAVLASLIAATGVHGLLAYAVTTRTSEFGVRIALGARPADIVKLVLRNAGAVAIAGVAAGVPAALAGAYAMRSLLFGIGPTDPMSLTAAAAALALTLAVACAIPARRAAAVDPIAAMRTD